MRPDLVDVAELVPGYVNLSHAYHNYTIEWAPEYIHWEVDGVIIRNTTKANVGTDSMTLPTEYQVCVVMQSPTSDP